MAVHAVMWYKIVIFVPRYEGNTLKPVATLAVVSLRVRAAGGNANNGANAGAFYVNANYAASNANANYSSPLYLHE